MKKLKYILTFAILLASNIVLAQVKFEVKVSKKTLGLNERLRVDFEMNRDGDNFNPPSFEGFTIVGGPNRAVSNSWINGKRTYSQTYSYFLAPKQQGKFTIKQATIEIDGEVYKTFPVTITVKEAVSNPNGAPTASEVASEKIHLVAEVSKANPYLNEGITVVYKLYVSPETGVSNWQIKDNPKYNDFWSQNLEVKGIDIKKGIYKGEEYRYVVLRKTVLYPQKTGKLKLEPLVLDITVEVPTNRRDIFGRTLMTNVPKTITAGNRVITVKPLPEIGKPPEFKGAVGEFNFKLSTSKTQLDATESLQAKIEVTGNGNLKLFELPKLVVPSSLEVYEPEHTENISTNLSGMQGSISDTYTIVPQFKGKYPIPTVSFSYFDPKSETYKRLNSDDIIIDVINGPSANIPNNTNTASLINKQAVDTDTNTFAFIKTKTDFESTTNTYFFKSKLFWILLLVPFLIIPLAILYKKLTARRHKDVQGNKIRKANKLARKYLSEAKKGLGDNVVFYEALERALHNYLKAKLNIETNDFNKDKIAILLKERNVEETVVLDFISILEHCELARYTPINSVTMQNDYDKAAKTISLIDKQIQ